jgi:hypothetical protein
VTTTTACLRLRTGQSLWLRSGQGRGLTAVALVLVAFATMAHVGSPDTFFVGTAGAYPIRVVVRLPGVIPGRAQVTVRVTDEDMARGVESVKVRAAQWNLGLDGAPPPDSASSVPGDPAVYATELWFMTANSYQLFVDVDGARGPGTAIIPVMALATAQRSMGRSLGVVLAALAAFLTLGMLTIVGAAVRESVLEPGVAPDAKRRRRSRMAIAVTAVLAAMALWGSGRWWTVEADRYRRLVLFRPFESHAIVREEAGRTLLTLQIRDPRWTGKPIAVSRYNELMPDHGKLMHLFLVREPALDAFAHLHPVPRTPAALDFDADLPPLPSGRYRVYGDIVHESGYAQTLIAAVELPGAANAPSALTDADDSWFVGGAASEDGASRFKTSVGPTIVWHRDDRPMVENEDRVLAFAAQDASGGSAALEPYMGMLAHVVIAHEDGSVFSHLHPAGSISMAAMQRFASAAVRPAAAAISTGHQGHVTPAQGDLSIPYAFPKPGRYRVWVQTKQAGRVNTAAFDAVVQPKK